MSERSLLLDPLSYNELAQVYQADELDAGLESEKDYEGWYFELGGSEGCLFQDMKVIRHSRDGQIWHYTDRSTPMEEGQIRIKLKVVGFTDEVAEMRNWQQSNES